ncbi:kinesin-like protein KIF15 isoform X2 [Notamacropus eugenii]|uniref:kinesin-like protein KIF15 isoform X2 n=2 Tax=Notamacropus eugenii TaxID=9315 RepID=UPI003B673DAF
MAPGVKGDLRAITPSRSNQVSNDDDVIKVFIRVRPPTEGPILNDGERPGMCLSVLTSKTLRLHSKPEPKIFTFDHVADMDTTQESVFSNVAKGIVESCMNGYNGTIFAYGQTGSGKTFTMMGPSESDNFTHNLRGVIPRSFEYLFFLIEREKEKAGAGKTFLCKCSFIEIYNEQIFDLLDSASTGLLLREHIKKGVCVVGAVEQVVTSAAEAYQVLSGGWRNRRVAATSMNRESSRSHAVFTVTVESMEKNNDVVNIRSSQLNLVDLAGSERQKDTHTEGLRLKEAGNINRSLSCLGQVITALVDVGNGKQRHVCYRDSKLTFLLRDSLGGNAKTAIIANVHPGSKCFGETLSTLNFAQRAKLIKNKAVVNEDMQGNVSQLQAEVKKLKEQLAHLAVGTSAVPDKENTKYMNCFREAMLFLKKSEHEKKSLLEKVAQLEDLSIKKEKFIQSNKMIVKFREDHIMRLEKLQREARGHFLPEEQEEVLQELREEIQTLREQIEHHPRIVKYAMENHSLREENKRLRSLESVKRVQEMDAQTVAKLEQAFFEISGMEKNDKGHQGHPVMTSSESSLSASVEKLRTQLLQTQGELSTSKQEYEEFKELTKKKQLELESELQSLRKANQSLESILEATKASRRQQVSQLNKIHAETLKIITTPTKAYQLRSRLVPRLSPEILNFSSVDTQNTNDLDTDIFNEPVPPEMNEQACEAISEELKMVQEQLSVLQAKLDEEESKNMKLQQHVDRLEHHSTQTQELFSSERTSWHKQQQDHLTRLSSLEKQLQDAHNKNEFMASEIQDLRIVLQSADKELSSMKLKYSSLRENQEKELSQLSQKHMNVQLQLDNVRLEHEKVLETKACLQDSYDNLQEVMKFETDQLSKELQDSQEANKTLQVELSNVLELLETEKERNNKLISQLEEDKENNSKKFLEVLDSVQQEKQKEIAKCEQQTAKIEKLEQSLSTAEKTIISLEKTKAADQEAVADLMSQIQDLKASVSEKNGSIDMLTRELEDITCKYNSTLTEKDDCKADLKKQEEQIMELKQALNSRKLSDDIERDMLCEDLAHATDQLNKLTEASTKHSVLLQSAQEELAKKEAFIQELQEQLSQKVQELEQKKKAYSLKMKHLECVMDSASVFPQSPKTPPSFQANLAKLLETQEQEIEDRRASTISLQHLVTKLNEERDVKNMEILRMKEQLCELENIRLELQQLTEINHSLQSQLDVKKQKESSDQEYPDIYQLKKEQEKEIAEERLAKNKAIEEMLKIKAELKEVKDVLTGKELDWFKMMEEVERTRALESKAFQEKEQLRSKLEELYEGNDKMLQEINMLRKQVEFLAEENGKLVGHTNPNQKIQYLVKLKKDNARLTEEAEKLRVENIFLKESRKYDICRDSSQIP